MSFRRSFGRFEALREASGQFYTEVNDVRALAERWRRALCDIADGHERPAEFARFVLDQDAAYTAREEIVDAKG